MHEAEVLRDGLDRELAACEALSQLAAEMQTALIARDTDAIHDIARRQTPLITRMERLAQAGRAALMSLASRLRLEPESATLSGAADGLDATDPELACALRGLRDRIAVSADRLSHLNWVNAQLLESAMDGIRFTFQLLARGAAEPEANYPMADGARRAASVLLDQRV